MSENEIHTFTTSQDDLLLYIGWRFATSSIIYNTLRGEINAIKSYYTDNGRRLVTRSWNVFHRVMRGFKKSRPARKRKAGVSLVMLQRFMEVLDDTDLNDFLIRAVLCFAFLGMLRVGEYTQESQNSQLFYRVLTVDSVTFFPSMDFDKCTRLELELNGSKTKQFGEKETVVFVCTCKHGVCAVHELLRYLELRDVKLGSELLFCWADGRVLIHVPQKNPLTMCSSHCRLLAGYLVAHV